MSDLQSSTEATPNSAAPSSVSTPSPAAAQQPLPEPTPAPADGIRDPEAYYRAQAEKAERLLEKERKARENAEAAFTERLAALEAQAKEQAAKAAAAALDLKRREAIADLNLDADTAREALALITADTDDGIKAQIESLRKVYGNRLGTARLGNSGQPPQEDLTAWYRDPYGALAKGRRGGVIPPNGG